MCRAPSFVRGLSGVLLTLLAGCQSYEIVQTNVFANEDGQVVQVDYGRSESDHVNTFVSPVTGKEMPFKSKLVVCVTLPDGDRFKAWQCMNFLPYGTMYETNDGEWKFLANGFSAQVYSREDDGRYREVYRGVLCDTPGERPKKDSKWRSMKKKGKEYRHEGESAR